MKQSEIIAVPAIGFTDESQADDYRDGLEHEPWLVGHANHERFYIRNRNQPTLETEILTSPRNFQRRDYPDKPTYRDATGEPTRTIRGAFNTLLVMGGKRSATFYYESRKRHEALSAIGFVPRDCFVVWRQGNGRPFDQAPVSVRQRITDGYGDDAETEIVRSEAMATRWARALLFAKRRHVQVDPHVPNGEGIGWLHQVHIVRVEVDIRDKEEGKPDTLSLLVRSSRYSASDGKYDTPSFTEDLDRGWHEMLEEAQAGFEAECVDCTPELEAEYEEVLAAARETHRAIARERASRSSYGGNGWGSGLYRGRY